MTELKNLDYYEIYFPKLGIDVTIDSDAFNIFGMTVKWYGIIIAIGIILAMLYGFSKMKRFGLDADRAVDAIFAGMIGGIIGARLYYVIMQWDQYSSDLKSIFNIRNGGLAIYGGIIGSILFAGIVAKIRKVKFLPLLDMAGICFLIGQSVGRWGNFVNHEAFGRNTNSLFGMSSGKIQQTLFNMINSTDPQVAEMSKNLSVYEPVHPCFLYESIWCLIGFLFLAWFSKRRKFDGQIFLMYVGWYGLGRFFIEGLRTDSLMIGSLRVSQVLAAICVVASAVLLVVIQEKVKLMGDDYVLYCNTEESKQFILQSEQKYNKKKNSENVSETILAQEDTSKAEETILETKDNIHTEDINQEIENTEEDE